MKQKSGKKNASASSEDARSGNSHSPKSQTGLHSEFSALKVEITSLRENERAEKDKLEFLRFQLDEIEGAGLLPGEDEKIEGFAAKIGGG